MSEKLTEAVFSMQCSFIAKNAAAWAGDILTLPEHYNRESDPQTVARFTDEMRDRLDRLDEWARRESASHGWKTIETAPKDWTDVILYVPDDDDGSGAEGVCQGWYSMEDGGFDCWMTVSGPVDPTYWMPLPSPPKP